MWWWERGGGLVGWVWPSAAVRGGALRLGATDVLEPGDARLDALAGDGFDLAVDSAGLVTTMEQSIALARRGGTITLLGAPPPEHE